MRRHIANDPHRMVEEALEGLQIAHPELVAFQPEHGFVRRAEPASDKVGLISGGGSGHEPLHAGFVGVGMLDVAVPGAVFASPTALQLYEATLAADSGRGVVHIVKNYTGDVLNFTIAEEIAADDQGLRIETVLVDDDLATDGGPEGGPGRRGTAAVLAVEKLCGAAAEQGADLGVVAGIGREVAARSRSMALALQAGTHPGETRAAFDLGVDEVEFGVGIHGERGRARVPYASADELADRLVEPLLEAVEPSRDAPLLVILNGLGGAYPLELQVATRSVRDALGRHGIGPARWLVGSYVTSLDMHGLSVTLVPLDETTLGLWDAPVRTPALTW